MILSMVKKKIMGDLIVMDDVSGIADSCKEFADFLTVSRKYRYHCVYVFHIIIPQREIWQKIISQIFLIFSPVAYLIIQLQKFYKIIASKNLPNMSLFILCG